MNLFRKTFFLLTLTSLPCGGGLFGQTGQAPNIQFVKSVQSSPTRADENSTSMTLGYCDEGNSGSISAQCTGPHTFGGAVYLPASILNKYVGDKIDSISFSISPMRGKLAQVFVSKELGTDKITYGRTSNYQKGWNTVKLLSPVTITADQPLYIGYEVVIGEDEAVDCVQFDTSPYSETNCSYYGFDGSWYSASIIAHNACVRAIVSGSNVPDNDISVSRIEAIDGTYLEQNSEVGYTVDVRNFGLQTVQSITFAVEANGEVVDEVSVGELDIPHNARDYVEVVGMKIPTEGNVTLSLKASKVNGETDPDDTDNAVSTYAYLYKEGTQADNRTVLFEHFTSEAYEDSPAADELYSTCLAGRTDVVWAKHHMNYAGKADQFVLDAESPYFDLFSDGKKFVPALAVDRRKFTNMEDAGPAYFVANDQMVTGLIDAVQEVPTFMHLSVAVSADEAQGTLSAKITGHAGTKEMPQQTDLRLTAWLVEDSIHSTQQVGYADYVQNGVIRALLSNDAWGDPLDISAYDFEKDYSIAIQDGWNVKNMRVVAFASNNGTSIFDRGIYNAAQGFVDSSTGISTVAHSEQPLISVRNGHVVLAQGATLQSVCDMAGRQVSPNHLSAGAYVVRATCGQRIVSTKVLIK